MINIALAIASIFTAIQADSFKQVEPVQVIESIKRVDQPIQNKPKEEEMIFHIPDMEPEEIIFSCQAEGCNE